MRFQCLKFCNLKEKIQVSFGILVLGLVLFLLEQAKGDFFTFSFAPEMTEFYFYFFQDRIRPSPFTLQASGPTYTLRDQRSKDWLRHVRCLTVMSDRHILGKHVTTAYNHQRRKCRPSQYQWLLKLTQSAVSQLGILLGFFAMGNATSQ
jgi:hypothetical protein